MGAFSYLCWKVIYCRSNTYILFLKLTKSISSPAIILVLAVLIGVGLRIIVLSQNRSFWWDESVYFSDSQLPLSELIRGNYSFFQTHPPLYLILLKILSTINVHETWLRSVSYFPSILTIFLLFMFTKRLTSNTLTASLASFLFATSTYHIYYSSFVKAIEAAIFLNLLTLYFFTSYIKLKRTSHLILYSLSLFLSFITSYYWVWLAALLGFMAVILFFFRKLQKKHLLLLFLGSFTALIGYSPWLIKLVSNVNQTLVLQLSSGILTLTEIVTLYAKFMTFREYHPLFIIFFLILLAFMLGKSKLISLPWKLSLLFWMLFPPIFILLIIYLMHFIGHGYKFNFSSWYVSFSSIALYIILATVLTNKNRLLVVCIMGIYLFSNINNFSKFLKTPTENWRDATYFLLNEQKLDTGDIVFTEDETHLRYYFDYRYRQKFNSNIVTLSYTELLKSGNQGVFANLRVALNQHQKSCVVTIFIKINDLPEDLRRHLVPPIFNENPYVFCFQRDLYLDG